MSTESHPPMNQAQIIAQTAEHVQRLFSVDSSGHDWRHTFRVWSLAKLIAAHEGGNLFVVELAALLHDIADWKFHAGDLTIGPAKARSWLLSVGVEERCAAEVCSIIGAVSFKGAAVPQAGELTLEGQIVQDADRLDALGAIGIARTFAYGGATGRIIYDPSVKPVEHATAESYLANQNPVINHFYEKLLLLKDLMNTNHGKLLAEKRHAFMERFLEEFFAEWQGA